MSTASSKAKTPATATDPGVTWGAWQAVIVAVIVFLAAQFIAALVVIYGYVFIHSASGSAASNWASNSTLGAFLYTLLAEAIVVASIVMFIRWRKGTLAAIGLKRPRLEDIPFALIGLLIYIPLLIVALILSEKLFHINLSQKQDTGFSSTTTGWPLLLVFFSVVILPPIAEETMFRGFIYSGLKKNLPQMWAAIGTSILFMIPHLLEGNGGGLLWSAGVDVFVLSMVLIWLREKTGRLYAGMGLHGLKNFIAFVQLYPVFHIHW